MDSISVGDSDFFSLSYAHDVLNNPAFIHFKFIEIQDRNWGCLPLCQTDRSETSGTNQRKMGRHCSIENKIASRTEAFHLCFDRHFDYFLVKWDWKLENWKTGNWKRENWRREFLKKERQVAVGPDRPVWNLVDSFFRKIFYLDRSIPFLFRPKFSEILA